MDKKTLMTRYKNHFEMLNDVEEKVRRNLWERDLLSDNEFHDFKMSLYAAKAVLADKWDLLRKEQILERLET